MGPRTVRITAEDFLTPAEFGELRLADHSAGQIGGVHLTLDRTAGPHLLRSDLPAGAAAPFPHFTFLESGPRSFT